MIKLLMSIINNVLNSVNCRNDFMITEDKLKKILPNISDPSIWADILSHQLKIYDMTSKNRSAAFIAQCAHESAQFNVLTENLNYSENALNAVFGKYFTGDLAKEYARNPEMIANRVYANRMGNGPEDSGDGWKYRGRGVIQLTGKNNYQLFSDAVEIDVVNNPDLVSNDKSLALKSALWFWDTNDLNKFADSGDFKELTRRINGGYNGLDDRLKYYNRALENI